MDSDLQSILIILALGAFVGWLAGMSVKGDGFGIIVNIIGGSAGAFLGNFIFAEAGISIGSGLVASLVSATVGAIVLVLIISIIRKIAK
jgi:uncharacterized membrane protein YeaQ/YmgE (transglycosylase-associated protein family)